MKKTIIVYGSTTGNCQEYAEKIAQKLGVSDVKNVAECRHAVWLRQSAAWNLDLGCR